MYYFFAAVVNEIADCFFVVPTSTIVYGRKCKILSMVRAKGRRAAARIARTAPSLAPGIQ